MNTKDLLLHSYDGELTPQEQQTLEKALETDADLLQEKKELDDIRSMLSAYQPRFTDDFQQNIVNQVFEAAPRKDFVRLFKAIALSGVAAVFILLLSIYFTDGSLNIDAIYGLSNYTPDEELFTYLNY